MLQDSGDHPPTGEGVRPAAQREALARTVVSVLTVLVVLDYADRSALGAVSPALRDDLGLSLADLGYLGGAFGLVGGLATLVAGALIDRVPRLRMLAVSALTWSVAMVATGAAQSLLWLLVSRACLAVVLATVGPAYPSLIGDAVAPAARARALGRVDAGQLVGGALGVGLGAVAVAFLDWRWAFFGLAVPALLVVPRLARTAEPARLGGDQDAGLALRAVAHRLWQTPTVVLVMLAVTVGSYYLAGASAFAAVFAVARYSVSIPVADLALVALGVGAVGGILLGSRASDALNARGRGASRLSWTAAAYLVTAAAWLPSLYVHSLLVALPFLVLGSAALASTIPALDAIRVDVVPPGMRGRAEAVRTFVRALAEGGAPLVFGLVAAHHGGDDEGLQLAFLLTLPGLVAAAVLLLVARRFHDRDRAPVAAVEAAEPAVDSADRKP